jgi:hypothetical protein
LISRRLSLSATFAWPAVVMPLASASTMRELNGIDRVGEVAGAGAEQTGRVDRHQARVDAQAGRVEQLCVLGDVDLVADLLDDAVLREHDASRRTAPVPV